MKRLKLSNIMLLIIFILISSCSGISTINKQKSSENVTQKQNGPSVKHMIVHPGMAVFTKFDLPTYVKQTPVLKCGEKEYEYYTQNQKALVVLGVGYFTKDLQQDCYWKAPNYEQKIATIQILPYKFPAARIHVDKKRVFLSKKDLARVKRERAMLQQIYDDSSSAPFFTEAFLSPLESVITSPYGERRIFNNKKKSYHLGIDFRARIGKPIRLSNDGKVVFAGDLFYTGNTVIVDHGMNIFTVYGHMSELKTQTGDFLHKGDIVGLAGMTGRSSGPHLHWGVKLHKEWINGFTLINASHVLQAELIKERDKSQNLVQDK
ncbi:MAG: M23 family metallopeptidase [bacterium]